MILKSLPWDTLGKYPNDIESTSWDTLGRSGTLWDCLGDFMGEIITNISNNNGDKKRCKYCGKLFIAHTLATQYCSRQCNSKDYKRRRREKQIADYLETNPQDTANAVDSPKSVLETKRFLTPREVALYLGIGKSSVYRELANGLIKAVQLRGKTLIRRKDIESMFDHAKAYQLRSGKFHQKREYYTVAQIVNKFHTSRCAVWSRCEKYGIKKIYQGRNTFYDKSLVDIHFAELIAEVDMNDYYTIDQVKNKFCMTHAAVLSFVQRNDIPRITQGRKVYYSRTHIDTFKSERENVNPLYYTYKEIQEKYKLSKDQINYYVHNYNIPNFKQGRLTIVERKGFDNIIKERMTSGFLDREVEKRNKQEQRDEIPEGYISIKQIAEQYGITEKVAQAKTREGKLDKLFIKHRNYFNAQAIEQLFNLDLEKFDVPEDYITAQKIAERFNVTVHHVHGRTRQAKIPKITVKHINFYELKAVEELFGGRVPVTESIEGSSIE